MNKKYKSKKNRAYNCNPVFLFFYNLNSLLNSLLNSIFFIPCCIVRTEIKKNKLRKSGHKVEPPIDYFFNPDKYSKTTNNFATTYEKYGKTYNSYLDIIY